MILLPRAVRVYFAAAPASLRKSFEGLSNEVRVVLGRDPLLCVVVGNVAAIAAGGRDNGFRRDRRGATRHIAE